MKQIKFTLDAFGPDGMLKADYYVKYDDQELLFIMHNKRYNRLSVVFNDGSANSYDDDYKFSGPMKMYRRTRTAEEVARETREKFIKHNQETTYWKWDSLDDIQKKERIAYVQAGMDEMKNI